MQTNAISASRYLEKKIEYLQVKPTSVGFIQL